MNFVKRIDDLGRVVIPKEIRRILDIQNDENLEIKVCNNEIVIKKYNLLREKEQSIIKLCKVINNLTSNNIILTDREKVIYSSNDNLIFKELSKDFKDIIINNNSFSKEINIFDNYIIKSDFLYKKLIIDSNMVGTIIFYGDNITNLDQLLLEIVINYINTI